jgi:hypothetical protein
MRTAYDGGGCQIGWGVIQLDDAATDCRQLVRSSSDGTYVNRVYREVDAISEIADGTGILDGAPLERRVRRVVGKPAPF